MQPLRTPTPWLLLLLGLVLGCSREEVPKADVKPVTPSLSSENSSGPLLVTQEKIHTGGPTGYLGSESCRSCHQDQFESWHRTYHRTMTQFARPETVRANFKDVTLSEQGSGTRFHLSQAGDELRVRMERVLQEPTEQPPPSVETQISLVTGSHHMQVFWVPGGDGNMQIGFPFTWLIPEQRWVPRNSTFIRPPGSQHKSEVWNVMCSRCHATAIEPRVDSQHRIMDSRVAELGISCEACHGPGQQHVSARKAAGLAAPKPDARTLAREIVHPEKIDPVRSAEICGFCHSMKWIDHAENWRQDGFRFRPGDDLSKTTPLIQPDQVGSIPGLQEYLARNPTLLEDYFWKDGMGRVSGREYNSLVASPCFKGGKFTCISCHSLHESEPADLLAANRQGNQACLQCHPKFQETQALVQHTHHAIGSTGSDCYNCHMPHTTYGILTAIRSHQISSPRVAEEQATGRPNACNLCHLDKSLGWTADHLAQWYRQPVPQLNEKERSISDAVRGVLLGDAGQRALWAWHLGWDPAQKASGSNWLAPVLGLLMDDPYAAVRCVADRSLGLESRVRPKGYDFVIEPSNRRSSWEEVWNLWMTNPPQNRIPPEVLVKVASFAEKDPRLEALLRERNQRPVRLRE